MKKLILVLAILIIGCESNVIDNNTMTENSDIVKGNLIQDQCVWIVGVPLQFSKTWYDANEHTLHLDSNCKPLNHEIHDGAKIILIETTVSEFYEGTISEVFNEYTAELNINAPSISNGEIDGCILVYE